MRALVTGASRGIGKAFSINLAKRGYDLTLVARTEKDLINLSEEIKRISKVNVKIISLDLSIEEDVKSLLDQERHTSYDLVINNAGFGSNDYFWEDNISNINSMIDLNIKSLTMIMHGFIKSMIDLNTNSKIVNISSIAAFPRSFPGMSVYAATKKYVKNLSLSVNQELEDRRANIKVIPVLPGVVDTNFYSNISLSDNKRKAMRRSITNPDYFAQMTLRRIIDLNKSMVVYGKMSLVLRIASKIIPHKWLGRFLIKKGF